MGKTKRKYHHSLMLLSKSLKKPLYEVASLMPKGFTNQMFIDEFKIVYCYLWEDLESKHIEYKRMDEGRKKKGFPKIYFFPSPADYIVKRSHAIISNTRFKHSKGDYLSDVEIFAKREILIQASNKKVEKRREKLENNLQLVQEVTPDSFPSDKN